MPNNKRFFVAALVTLISAIVFLAYGPTRAYPHELLIGFATAFIAYIIVAQKNHFTWHQLIAVAIGLRITLLFAPVTWTDDHYRYFWDGLCSTHGISPFAFTPEELTTAHPEIFAPEHFTKLNSPKFHSVYPPLAQFFFATTTSIGGVDHWRSTLVLRLIILAFETLTILALGALLKAHIDRIQRVALYALNPLVLMEFSVNLHTEALMIAPCLGAIYFFQKQRYDLSALLLALAATAKLWPLLFLAWIPSKPGIVKSIRYFAIVLGAFVLSWIPLYTADMLPHFASSLKLYISYLEFNGPFFELLRHVIDDQLVKGTGFLSALTLGAMLIYTIFLWRTQRPTWPHAMLWLLAIYLFGAQAVHPWYILPLVAFSVLTKWRWPILWSLLIVPTYLTYAQEPFTQPYWWMVIEYAVLAAYILWEIVNRKIGRAEDQTVQFDAFG